MSAKKTEVGDVFSNPRTGRSCVVNYDYQFDNMEYPGKSKASIKDLFEVE